MNTSKPIHWSILLAAMIAVTLVGCGDKPKHKDLSKATVKAAAPTSQTPPPATTLPAATAEANETDEAPKANETDKTPKADDADETPKADDADETPKADKTDETPKAPKEVQQPPQVRDILEQLAAKKTVWVIATGKQTKGNAESKKNLAAFLADPANKDAKTMVIRMLDIDLAANALFLKALSINPKTTQCTTLVLAPPKKIMAKPILGAASLKAIKAAAKPCTSCGPGG